MTVPAKRTLILASQSPARKELLTKLLTARFPQFTLAVKPAYLDETGLLKTTFPGKNLARDIDLSTAKKMAATLAKAKARAIDGDFVLGSDQLLFLPDERRAGGRVLGKPGSHKNAVTMLSRCGGKTAYLVTSVALHTIEKGRSRVRVATQTTELRFARLTKREIDRVVTLDQPYECAGSFKFEEHGATLFDSIRTDDPTGIQGLPLMRVIKLLSFS